MPTRPDTVARGPNEPGQATPSEQVAFGRQQWVRKWRVFASQFSQPQLMKLAASVLGEQAIHSSQIHGFSTGKLRDPAPKVLLSIGRLNLAIARSNGSDDAAEGERCPGSLTELWSGKKWLTDEQGKPMGPYEVFGAVTGLIDLGTDNAVDIDPADQAAVSKSLGKFWQMGSKHNSASRFPRRRSSTQCSSMVQPSRLSAGSHPCAVRRCWLQGPSSGRSWRAMKPVWSM